MKISKKRLSFSKKKYNYKFKKYYKESELRAFKSMKPKLDMIV